MDSISVKKGESQPRSLMQLINHLFVLMSTEIKKAHRRRIGDTSFLRSNSNFQRRLIFSCSALMHKEFTARKGGGEGEPIVKDQTEVAQN